MLSTDSSALRLAVSGLAAAASIAHTNIVSTYHHEVIMLNQRAGNACKLRLVEVQCPNACGLLYYMCTRICIIFVFVLVICAVSTGIQVHCRGGKRLLRIASFL
jgi:hypothetical protein